MLVCLFSPVEQWLASEGWRVLFPRGRRPTTMRTFLASWMGSAVNTLLPVATIGGEHEFWLVSDFLKPADRR